MPLLQGKYFTNTYHFTHTTLQLIPSHSLTMFVVKTLAPATPNKKHTSQKGPHQLCFLYQIKASPH